MSSLNFFIALLIAIAQSSWASYSFGGFGAPVAGIPIAHSAPIFSSPIAFHGGPFYPSLTPAIHPVHHSSPIEIHNVIRSTDKETRHFSGTMHRTSGFPFHRKN
ncbi:hypothetical protein Y032_0349g3198 [Ancylostoma ceylanicum]|uniref:Uncharacterized protein n=1 Tax=Ancylostoma ceylanicum TaxID=53326 RepID=A0A016RXY4_9BILA|nr:hypothetical protein Y032_0349g3198 [Ancylostoma ceylanicum]